MAGFFIIMPEYNLNEGVNTVAGQKIANAKFLEGQNTLTSDFLTKFGNTITGQGTTADAAERIGGELGLPQLRQNAFNLNQSLIDLPGLHTSANRGFDVNANQLGRIINEKTSQIAPLAQRATAQAQFAEGELGTRLGYLQNDWNRQLLPLTTEKDFLTDRMARETSMYTQDNQNELNAIMDKIKNGITISEAEKARAHALSLAEKGYENALTLAREKNNQPYAVTPGSSIYNPVTGKSKQLGWG